MSPSHLLRSGFMGTWLVTSPSPEWFLLGEWYSIVAIFKYLNFFSSNLSIEWWVKWRWAWGSEPCFTCGSTAHNLKTDDQLSIPLLPGLPARFSLPFSPQLKCCCLCLLPAGMGKAGYTYPIASWGRTWWQPSHIDLRAPQSFWLVTGHGEAATSWKCFSNPYLGTRLKDCWGVCPPAMVEVMGSWERRDAQVKFLHFIFG